MLDIYRGLNESGDTIVFLDGDPDQLIQKAAEKFSGDEVGVPNGGTTAIKIGKVEGCIIAPEEELIEKQVAPNLREGTDDAIDEELHKLNMEIAKRGIKIVPGSAETRMIKVEGEEEGTEEEEEERTVLSVVLEPNDGEDGAPLAPDTQGDIYSKEAIKNTAWGWMEKGGKIGLMHQLDVTDKVAVLESYVALSDIVIEEGTKKYTIRKGSWVLRLRLYDDLLWKKAKDGTLGAFSVGGTAQVQYLEDGDSEE